MECSGLVVFSACTTSMHPESETWTIVQNLFIGSTWTIVHLAFFATSAVCTPGDFDLVAFFHVPQVTTYP